MRALATVTAAYFDLTRKDKEMEKYIVMTASTTPVSTCWGIYRRVAVVKLEDGFRGTPKMISIRARGVDEIIETWENRNVGSTPRCAYRRALAAAEDLAAELNHDDPSQYAEIACYTRSDRMPRGWADSSAPALVPKEIAARLARAIDCGGNLGAGEHLSSFTIEPGARLATGHGVAVKYPSGAKRLYRHRLHS